MAPLYLSLISLGVILFPTLGVGALLVDRFVSRIYSEKRITGIVSFCLGLSCLCSLLLTFIALHTGQQIEVTVIPLFGHEGIPLFLDSLSLPFVVVSTSLSWLVSLFSKPYLHRESGHYRFFLLLLGFVSAILLVFMSKNLHGVFIGWEVVGLASTLLISFFYSDCKTVKSGLTAFFSYRAADVGLVLALIIGHKLGHTSFSAVGEGHSITGASVTLFSLGILWASLGKSSQYPFVRWLPRAMEGPTPSSAIFYGAISVHAGVYLMLRTLLSVEVSPIVALLMGASGVFTAFYGTLLGRIQSDVKSSLAYASMAQVGLMFLEMGIGLRDFVVLHFVGHAVLRTYQLLHAPAAFQVHGGLERLHLAPLECPGGLYQRLIPRKVQLFLYRVSFKETTYRGCHSFGSLALLRFLSEKAWSFEHGLTFLATEGSRRLLIASSPRRTSASRPSLVAPSIKSHIGGVQ